MASSLNRGSAHRFLKDSSGPLALEQKHHEELQVRNDAAGPQRAHWHMFWTPDRSWVWVTSSTFPNFAIKLTVFGSFALLLLPYVLHNEFDDDYVEDNTRVRHSVFLALERIIIA